MNPGHVENCLLLIDFRSVCLGGLNADCWRYLMSAVLNFIAYALYAIYLLLTGCVSVNVLFDSCSGNIHNIFCGLRPPFHTSLLL